MPLAPEPLREDVAARARPRSHRPAAKVSVVPPHPRYADNALFHGRVADRAQATANAHWMDYFVAFRHKADEHNILLGTSDVLPIAKADMAMFVGCPEPPVAMAALKAQHPHTPFVLLAVETALGSAYMLDRRNLRAFDAVITHQPDLVDNVFYYPLRPRAYDKSHLRTGLAFAERRVGCFVGTSQRFARRTGLGALRNGWRFTPRSWWDYAMCPGELGSRRTALARRFSAYAPHSFDLFGVGWDEFPETQAICSGVPPVSILDLAGSYRFCFAYENHTATNSLISERLWDALWGDSVPVYAGNKSIGAIVPRECFIDADEFRSPETMLDFLVAMSERDWMRYRAAGRRFLEGDAIRPYLPEAAADDLLMPLLKLLGQRDRAVRRPMDGAVP